MLASVGLFEMGDLEKWILLTQVCQKCVGKNRVLQVKGQNKLGFKWKEWKTRSDGEVCNTFSQDTIVTICNFWARLT